MSFVFVFLLGLIVGSFLNCVIYRLDKKESPLFGRSFCPHCHHKLEWFDLIPIVSFLLLKGKCRYCHKKISWQYPIIEITVALLFLFLAVWLKLKIQLSSLLEFSFLAIIFSFLIIIFVYDLKKYIIPDKVIFPAIFIAFFYQIFKAIEFEKKGFDVFFFWWAIFSAFVAAGFFLSIYLISKGKWLGFGDVKLVFFMGLFLSWPKILEAIFLAFLIGAIVGIILIAKGKKTPDSEIPFAPFLVTATLIVFFEGGRLFQWYLSGFF